MSFKIDHINLLQSISRKQHRKIIKLDLLPLPFMGKDIWTLYELSWLNKNGLPQVAIARIEINATSDNIIESKSLKIYINSFNQIKFDSYISFVRILKSDLTKCAKGEVSVEFFNLDEIKNQKISNFHGHCIDNQDIKIKNYKYDPSSLVTTFQKEIIEESLYSNLLKSNCPITKQPDWASIHIVYTGRSISHSGLLSYLISFRTCNKFHEECVERMFTDIQTFCQPEKLSIYARYTRRGGIDINPWRSNSTYFPSLIRMARQ